MSCDMTVFKITHKAQATKSRNKQMGLHHSRKQLQEKKLSKLKL